MVLLFVDPIKAEVAPHHLVPLLTHTNAAVVRGDGIFESALVRNGQIVARDLHLERFSRSARLMDLGAVDLALWNRALDTALAQTAAQQDTPADFMVKWVLYRADPATGAQAAWVESSPIPASHADTRAYGVRAVTLCRGYQAGMAAEAPWLLIGVKSVSYAVHAASNRFAHARGAGEAIWVTTDGFVLEAPTSNVIVKRDGQLLTPDPDMGLLHGTTQQLLFQRACAAGWECRYARLRQDDLFHVDSVWLLSSVRGAVPVTHINSSAIAVDDDATRALTELITR